MFTTSHISAEMEEQRLTALYSYDILGDGLENELDNLVKLASQIGHTPIAYVTLVDRTEVVLKAVYGYEFSQTNRVPRDKDVVSQFAMWSKEAVVIEDTLLNEKLAQNPMVVDEPHVRFYCSVPLNDNEGFPLGCLTLLDLTPHKFSDQEIEALKTVAVQIIAQLELKRKNATILAQNKKFDEITEIFTISPEIHCILDRSGCILFINQAVTPLLDYTVEEVIGETIWQYCHEDDVDNILHSIEDSLRNGSKQFNLDFRLTSKFGQIKWIGWGMVAKGERWYCYGRDITEMKVVESELIKLSFVASKVNNGVVINDVHNTVTWVNDAFERITGFTLEDLKGRQLGDLISGPDTDWAKIENARKLTQQKQSFAVDILAYRKDKQQIWLSVYNTVVLAEDGKVESEVEIIIDITEQKKAEEELKILSLVASSTNTGVVITDPIGKITWVNKAFEDLVGYRLDELIGKIPGDMLSGPETDQRLIDSSRVSAAAKQGYGIETLAHKKDGTPIWLSVANTPLLDANGELERQVELIDDITKRKQVEKEILDSRERALQLSEAKEMFLSVMSHEIRTPLNAVIGMTHLLLDNEPKASQIDDLNILKFSGENLLNIINDILDFTKIETGNLMLESTAFDLHALSVDIINSLQLSASKRGNQLTLSYDDQIPEQLLGDKTRLYQVLINLLGNAIKFTDNGKVELLIKVKSIKKNGALIYFEVKDTGIGIPKDKQSYIFETFTQARADISRKFGGTGLGLAITKKLIKLFNSEITVESVEGKGTSFIFLIKFSKLTSPIVKSSSALLPNMFADKKVLVVDDNEVNILIAKRFLSKWGLLVDFASSGEEAIPKIMNNHYDLVFMDIRMPGLDGFDTTRIIRDLPEDRYKNLPIIALTASTLNDENMKFKEAGMDGHILKPFNPNDIKEILSKYLEK